MDNFELNKIAAGVFIAGLVALIIGNLTEGVLYKPEEAAKRGYEIEVADMGAANATEAEVEEVPIDVAVLMATADVSSGEKLFKQCATCHSAEQGGPNRVGPGLWGVWDATIGTHDGYKYSKILTQYGEEGRKWTAEELYAFIKKPRKYAKDTKMGYAGMKKDTDLADLLAYLRTLQ